MQNEETIKPVSNVGRANYRNVALTISANQAIFSVTWQAKAGIILFSIGVLSFFVFWAFLFFIEELPLTLTTITTYLLFLSAVLAILIWSYRRIDRRCRFDLHKGIFYVGNNPNKSPLAIKNIQKLHIIRRKIYSNNSNYYAHQLLMELNNKQRIGLIDHSEKEIIKTEAQQLAEFLQVECEYHSI